MDAIHQKPACLLLTLSKIKVTAHVTFRNDERVVLCSGVFGKDRIGLTRFGKEGDFGRGVTERTVGFVLNLRVGPIAVDFTELGTHNSLKWQTDVRLIRRDVVLVVLSIAGAFKVPSHGIEGRAGGAKIFGDVHEHVCLLPFEEHVQHVMAENGVERAVGALWGVVGIVSFHFEALFAQKVNIGPMPAAEIEHAAFDTAQSEKFSGWE